MKQSFLKNAISMALTGTILTGSVLSTQVYASDTNGDTNNVANSNSNDVTTETYLYPGLGVGAAAGALIAGPVGLLVGGAIGAFVGDSKTVDTEVDSQQNIETVVSDEHRNDSSIEQTTFLSDMEVTDEKESDHNVQLAQAGSLTPVIDNEIYPQEDLMNILVSDLSLDVYFRSGSTDIEKFYPARLIAIANLANSMENLELHLDGYTDRRGDKDQNIALAETRIEKVRQQLIDAGVSPDRIVSKAFGEAKMKSTAGNLEAYTFDRRVVIRFERTDEIKRKMTTAFSAFDMTTEISTGEISTDDNGDVDVSTGDISTSDVQANDTGTSGSVEIKQSESSLIMENTYPVIVSDNNDPTNHF